MRQRNQAGALGYRGMTEPELLREQARTLRDLAADPDAADIKDLLLHMAEQCERLAERVERRVC